LDFLGEHFSQLRQELEEFGSSHLLFLNGNDDTAEVPSHPVERFEVEFFQQLTE
jgi:hypothetical protein